MMTALPNFWKIAKGFLDGKYRKVRYFLTSEAFRYRSLCHGDIDRLPDKFAAESIAGSDDGTRYRQTLRVSPVRVLCLLGHGGDDAVDGGKFLCATFTRRLEHTHYGTLPHENSDRDPGQRQ